MFVPVVARVYGVSALVELQREERVLSPRGVGVHVDGLVVGGEAGVPPPAHAADVHLGTGGQVHGPQLGGSGDLGTRKGYRLLQPKSMV